MPQFSGETDKDHRFALASAIERVQWDRRQAAPGGTVGLDVRTQFCSDGSPLQIQLQDAQGTVHNSLSGQLNGNHVRIELSVPQKAKGGLLANVKLPNHGLSAESPVLQIVKPVRVRGPRWSTETARRGEAVTLTAEARGAPNGRQALVRIFERDPRMGAHDPVATLRPRVKDEAIEVEWQVALPGDPSAIPPEWKAPEGYTQPQLFYELDVSGLRAASKDEKSKGLLTITDHKEIALTERHGPPFPKLNSVTLQLPDGTEVEETPNEDGLIVLEDVPPGPVRIIEYSTKDDETA